MPNVSSIPLRATTPGFENTPTPKPGDKKAPVSVNLMTTAIDLVKDGDLSTQDLEHLTQIAHSDGDLEASEGLLLDSLNYSKLLEDVNDSEASFVDQVNTARQQADFNPNTFEISTHGILSVPGAPLPDGKKSDVVLRLSNERINGGPRTTQTCNQTDQGASAREHLQRLILNSPSQGNTPNPEAVVAWGKTDKFNLTAVRDFMQSRHFSPAEQAEFTQTYLQGYYDHTGLGADFGGITDIQQQLSHLPVDGGGRKFIDCEGFSAITQMLFPGTQSYVVHNSGGEADPSAPRNHQVSVMRIGDQRFVQNNDVIQEITAAQIPPGSTLTTLSDEKLIESFVNKDQQHPLSRPALDSTPMADGSEVYDVGEVVILKGIEYRKADGEEEFFGSKAVQIREKIDDFNLRVDNPRGERFILRFDPARNSRFLLPDPLPATP
ncbi:MAG: hypothetical protein ACO1RX_03025 [Candidatus Sericytochromatia bacterium]